MSRVAVSQLVLLFVVSCLLFVYDLCVCVGFGCGFGWFVAFGWFVWFWMGFVILDCLCADLYGLYVLYVLFICGLFGLDCLCGFG